jgi:plasmid stabilization system protein ParE
LARLIYSREALDQLERLVDFLLENDPAAAQGTVELIEGAVDILGDHPLIGRPAGAGLREILISRGHSGYVALYSFERAYDTILILAIRHQREAGYSGEDDC